MNISNTYKNISIFFLIIFLGFNTLASQSGRIELSPDILKRLSSKRPLPTEFQALEITSGALENIVRSKSLELPISHSETLEFILSDNPIMEPGLSERYPDIKTYIGNNDQGDIAYIDITSAGMHAVIKWGDKTYYLDAIDRAIEDFYILYDVDKYPFDKDYAEGLYCDTKSSDNLGYAPEPLAQKLVRSRTVEPVTKRTFIIAVATTSEYCQFHGGTVESTLAAIVTAINRVNSIYHVDLATQLVLHEDTDQLIFCSSPDPYTNGNTTALLDENPQVIRALIPVTTYDIGHVFCTNAGGRGQIASVCTIEGKDRGASCSFNPINDPYYVGILSHELGHQFGANHIFNGANGACTDNISSSTAYEPGSGTTIMSYAGICGSDNVSNIASPYYNAHSLLEINDHIITGTGSNCPQEEMTNNTPPEIHINMPSNVTIPIGTPFELIGSADDAENDELTYTWEQHDLGIQANLGSPVNGSGPLFRSFSPSTSPNRIIPVLSNILNTFTSRDETLPSVSRSITFLYTVRDNNSVAGGVSIQEYSFRSAAEAGPFIISSNNVVTDLTVGQMLILEWNVANTEVLPINCDFVDIYYSADGGLNFNESLALSAANTGRAIVTIPDITTDHFRFKIKGANNIFFDVTDNNSKVLEASSPNYIMNIEPYGAAVCAPENVVFAISTQSIQSFDAPIVLSLASDLPIGVDASILTSQLSPGESTEIHVSLYPAIATQRIDIDVLVSVGSQAPLMRRLTIDVQSTDFSEIDAIEPLDGLDGTGTSQIFSWAPSLNANSYLFQMATDPLFNDILFEEGNVSESEIDLSTLSLEGSTTYYWRIQPTGPCGSGEFTNTYVFNTVSFSCQSFQSQDVPLTVTNEIDTAKSMLTITDNLIIEDLNVKALVGAHANIGDLIFDLTSPNNTVIRLLARRCNQQNAFNLSLDDDVLNVISCPIDRGLTYKPREALSAFDNEETAGSWTLRMIDAQNGNGGILNGWGLEFCSFMTPSAPLLVINRSITINPLEVVTISNQELFATDSESETQEIIYTLVNTPAFGNLTINNVELGIGMTFTQADINNNLLIYTHDNEDDIDDAFKFFITNPSGGWLGGLTYTIVVDEIVDAPDVASDIEISIYPNPASNKLTINMPPTLTDNIRFDLVDIQGRFIRQGFIIPQSQEFINIDYLSPGTYLLLLHNESINAVAKFIKLE